MPTTAVGREIDELRRSVRQLSSGPTKPGISLFTMAVVSVRVLDVIVLKPAGVPPHDLAPDSIVVVDLSGEVLDGVLAPSSDGGAHAYVYREMGHLRAIVNTRSTLSLAAAARGEPVPSLPATAAELGGPIPVGAGGWGIGEATGRGIVDTMNSTGSPAVLVRGGGLFTVGSDTREAVGIAASLEQLIRTVHVAHQLGTSEPLDPQDIAWLTAGAAGEQRLRRRNRPHTLA